MSSAVLVADAWHSHHWLDFRDWLGAAATSIAAILAWRAIEDSRKQSALSAKALIRERRIDHELNLLKEIAEYNSWDSNRGDRSAQIKFRLRLISADLLPVTRAFFAEPPTPEHTLIVSVKKMELGLRGFEGLDAARQAVLNEIEATVQALLAERDDPRSIKQVSRTQKWLASIKTKGPDPSVSAEPGP